MDDGAEREPLDRFEIVALRMAASGHISGTLAQWPCLASAFRKLGVVVLPSAGILEVRRLARDAVASNRDK